LANHPSALKRHRQSLLRRERNRFVRKTVRTYVKRVRAAVEEGDVEGARVALATAIPALDKAAAKGVIHPRNASRNISRLSRCVGTLAPKA
jgi:small subunit ribosomal protein S20